MHHPLEVLKMPGLPWIRNAVVTVAALTVMNGCALLRKFNTVDPRANFVAHPGYTWARRRSNGQSAHGDVGWRSLHSVLGWPDA